MKILVLAGGFDQIALIERLRKLGNYVILADYYENPPAKKYADKHYQISTLDEKAVLEVAQKEEVELITTACTDQALLTMAKVSEKLKLPTYISYETALHVTNKLYMKEIFYKNNIPTSKYRIVKSLTDCQNLDMKYPLVVKPCDCNSSKGVKKVLNENELEENISKCLELSRTNSAIVEEFKEGIELSIDVFSEDYEIKLLSITKTEKIKNNKGTFTICKSVYPIKEITEKNIEYIKNIAGKIAKAFELKKSPILIQAILKNDEINVLEFSARMGGGTKYKLIEVISGVNIMDQYIKLVLGENVQIEPQKMVEFAELNYCYCHNGTISKFEGFEELKNSGTILDYFQYKTPGMKIDQALNSGDRAAGFLITAKTEEEIGTKREEIIEKIKILDENNKNIYMKNYEVN